MTGTEKKAVFGLGSDQQCVLASQVQWKKPGQDVDLQATARCGYALISGLNDSTRYRLRRLMSDGISTFLAHYAYPDRAFFAV